MARGSRRSVREETAPAQDDALDIQFELAQEPGPEPVPTPTTEPEQQAVSDHRHHHREIRPMSRRIPVPERRRKNAATFGI